MAYSNKVIDHYENPRNVGSLPKDDVNVGTGLVGAPECGDVMKLQVEIDDGIPLSRLASELKNALVESVVTGLLRPYLTLPAANAPTRRGLHRRQSGG